MKPTKFVLTSALLFLVLSLPFMILHKPDRKPLMPPIILEEAEPRAEPFHLVSTARAQDSSISGLDNTSTLDSNYLFIVAIPGVANRNISYGQLTNLFGIFTSGTNTVVTNLTVISDVRANKVYATYVTMLSASATNGFFVYTNIWSGGPTGTLDMSLTDQGRASITACSVTGIFNKSNTVVESVVLSLTNTASTNWLLTLDGGIRLPQRTNQVAVSNGTMATLTLRYHPAFGTNGVFVQF